MEHHNQRRLHTLVELAVSKLAQNISHITDVGSTPFHLLAPVLERMNAKQLEHIETVSPQLMPETDKLWFELIQKDFPNRPEPKSARKLPVTATMPYRKLYHQYVEDRESFRNDSAQRLRNITERLRLQKSANKIVKVPELLKDPTVKKSWGSGVYKGYNYYGVQRNSILNKCRREVRERAQIFPKSTLQKYDGFEVQRSWKEGIHRRPQRAPVRAQSRQLHQSTPLHLNNTSVRSQSRQLHQTNTPVVPQSRQLHQNNSQVPSYSRPRQITPTTQNISHIQRDTLESTRRPREVRAGANEIRAGRPAGSVVAAPAPSPSPPPPPPTKPVEKTTHTTVSPVKRRPPSIFLASKRHKPSAPSGPPKPKPKPAPEPSRIKAIKSSIFS